MSATELSTDTHQMVYLTPTLDENFFPKLNFLGQIVFPNIILKK